ncbi:uncharacterized protein LOC131016471 [Salvia miltiorrhiza]|uniref:uncharacterized protein LOC131016471 n=1 Tax=Salvia miltiorrhiza TaxID=226208 RepID=UPI0025AD48C5|nr:uncharacterized protein LOC131016471 [Salvia miltiorrhiza]
MTGKGKKKARSDGEPSSAPSSSKRRKVTEAEVERIVKMSWADSKNTIDTEVYLMRHFETFMGDGKKGWACNLSNKRPHQLQRLRVRYCATILAWEGNNVKKAIGEKATYAFTKLCKNSGFNVNSALLG